MSHPTNTRTRKAILALIGRDGPMVHQDILSKLRAEYPKIEIARHGVSTILNNLVEAKELMRIGRTKKRAVIYGLHNIPKDAGYYLAEMMKGWRYEPKPDTEDVGADLAGEDAAVARVGGCDSGNVGGGAVLRGQSLADRIGRRSEGYLRIPTWCAARLKTRLA